jgi:predicted dehydrogenase
MIANSAHLPAWKNLVDDVEVVGVADIIEERAQLTAKAYDVPRAYGDWQKMLDEVKPDFVSVCTPNAYHKAPTIAALKGGAHVCCEKPITISTADAEEMYDTADAAGRELFITQTTRFSNSAFTAKELIESGKLGEMYYAETAMYRRRGIPKWGVFHMKKHNAGGPVYDLGVHVLDLLIWVMGNPRITAVSGMTYTKFGNIDENLATSLADSGAPSGVITPRPYDYHEFDVEDFAACIFRLEDDATIVLRTSWAANVPEGANRTFIFGTKAGLQLMPEFQLIANVDRYQGEIGLKVPSDLNVPFFGHWEHMAHALCVVRGEEEKIVKRAEVINVMRALEGLYKSAEEGREIRLD